MGELVLLMGPTGAGKSTQGDWMAQSLGGVHLSSGNLLRDDPQVAAMLSDGRLMPAKEVHRVVGDAIGRISQDTPIVLDGIPRRDEDVKWLEAQLPQWGRTVRCVIVLELDLETSLMRLGGRDRLDDAPEAIRHKYELYHEKTEPVVSYYEQQGLLRRIDGRGTPEAVRELIKTALQ